MYLLLIFVSSLQELGIRKKKKQMSGQWLLREDHRNAQDNPEALISTSLHSFTLSQAPSACPGKERNAFILITYMSSHGRLNCRCRWPRQSVCSVCTTSLHLLRLPSHHAHTFWTLTGIQRKSITWNIEGKKKRQQTLILKQWKLCWR